MADAVDGQVGAMAVSEVGKLRDALDAERGSCGGAQLGAGEHGSVVGEADEASIEGCIPQCREE